MKLIKWLHWKVWIVNIAIFLFMSVLISYLAGKLPERIYDYQKWIFKVRKWERDGKIYQHILKIKRWKGFLPEVSDYFQSTFPKKHIREYSKEYLSVYLMESCRSELTHWNIIFSSLFFLLWDSVVTTMSMMVLATLLNLPYIIIQRYNRPRVVQIVERMGR